MQKSEKNGLNLNPMYFWPHVMGYQNRACSKVVIRHCVSVFKICELAKEYTTVNFVLEDYSTSASTTHPNILWRWTDRLTYEEWVRGWSTTDYLLCDEIDRNYWMQAQLCGVKIFFDLKTFEQELKTGLKILSSVERINNWESAKNLLT